MRCPVCNSLKQNELDFHLDGFREDIIECLHCGVVWSINHDLVEIVEDPQEASFLSVLSENVDGDDYCYAA